MMYDVMGTQELQAGNACNFIVIHDFFDTYEHVQIFFKSVVKEHRGCQALVFNYPGQAGSRIAEGGGIGPQTAAERRAAAQHESGNPGAAAAAAGEGAWW